MIAFPCYSNICLKPNIRNPDEGVMNSMILAKALDPIHHYALSLPAPYITSIRELRALPPNSDSACGNKFYNFGRVPMLIITMYLVCLQYSQWPRRL